MGFGLLAVVRARGNFRDFERSNFTGSGSGRVLDPPLLMRLVNDGS